MVRRMTSGSERFFAFFSKPLVGMKQMIHHWKEIIEQCQSRPKEQTAKQWLKEHDISDKAYYYWLRKIRRTIYDQSVASGTLPVVP